MEERDDLMLKLFWSLRKGSGARVEGVGVKLKKNFFLVPERVEKNKKMLMLM